MIKRRLLLILPLLVAACDERPEAAPEWLTAEVYDSLFAAGLRAIPSGDVPAAAAVIYRGRIHTGWNNVNATANPAGHADINAIAAVMRAVGGARAFSEIDRDSLFLVTTWEPCPMCAGAIGDEHRFRPENVVVLMLKEDLMRRSERVRMSRLAARRRYVESDLQQRLFCRHPGYRRENPGACEEER